MSDGTPLPNRSAETPVSGRDYPEDDPSGRRWSEIWRAVVEELNANALVSDLSTNRIEYDPEDGTLYVPTDGGNWFIGTGTGWTNLGPIGDIGDHVSDTTNPHSVTAAQVDALSTTGGTVTGDTTFTTTTHDSVNAAEVNITSGELWTEEGTVVGESVGIDNGDSTPSGHPELCLWVDHGERTGWQITGSKTYIDPFLPPDPSSTYTVSHWPMDEGIGTTAADADGDNDLTLNGPTWETDAGEGGAYLLFDGTDDTADGTEVPITGSTNRTIIAWINPISTDSDSVLSAWGSQATGARWTFYTSRATVGDGLRIEIEGGGYTSSLVPQTNTWQMVAVVLDGTTLGDHLLYLDGVTEQAAGTLEVNTAEGDPVRFGNWNYGTGTSGRYYNGLCDSPVILDREVSVELLDEYRAATESRYSL